jgi:hypothetical protein
VRQYLKSKGDTDLTLASLARHRAEQLRSILPFAFSFGTTDLDDKSPLKVNPEHCSSGAYVLTLSRILIQTSPLTLWIPITSFHLAVTLPKMYHPLLTV